MTMTKATRQIKLSEIEDKSGFLYRIAKAKLERYGFYFCHIDGKKVEIIR